MKNKRKKSKKQKYYTGRLAGLNNIFIKEDENSFIRKKSKKKKDNTKETETRYLLKDDNTFLHKIFIWLTKLFMILVYLFVIYEMICYIIEEVTAGL